MFAWTWNDKCLPYAFMLALMASDDGFGCYGLSKCINIGTCMHSKEIEHQANADQRHMSLPEPGRHITQILKSYDTLILKLGNFFFSLLL